jgi:ribonuclease HI
MIKVFTDGACSNNGKVTAKAGLGVYFSEKDPRNTSKRIIGKQSNNTAELSAVIEVFSILKDEIKSNQEIIIYSDSMYTIRWCGEYGRKCEANGFKSKKTIPNLELGKELYLLCKEKPNIKLEHIRAHTGLTDELSLGNEGADRMANEAIGLKSCPHAKTNHKQKYYLKIPYSEKEVGKKYGTKWDPKKKKWYYEGLNTDTNFLKLMELFQY